MDAAGAGRYAIVTVVEGIVALIDTGELYRGQEITDLLTLLIYGESGGEGGGPLAELNETNYAIWRAGRIKLASTRALAITVTPSPNTQYGSTPTEIHFNEPGVS